MSEKERIALLKLQALVLNLDQCIKALEGKKPAPGDDRRSHISLESINWTIALRVVDFIKREIKPICGTDYAVQINWNVFKLGQSPDDINERFDQILKENGLDE